MQAGNRCGATGLKKCHSTCWNCGYNRKASGRVGTNFVPALPDTFHSFGKYYYPTIRKDTFVEVSGEVAEALEEGLRIERRQEKKKLYHKVFSMDTNDWTQLHISIYAQSPEDVLLRAEEHAEQERNLSRMTEAFAHLTPTQARRIRARYMGGKKLREIGELEGTGESEAGHSVRSGIRRMRRYFIQQKWLNAQKED